MLRVAVLLSCVLAVTAEGYLRVCYYSNWAQYRPVPARMTPRKIDPKMCTHLIYAFAKIDFKNEINFTEWNDGQMVKDFTGLKKENPYLKTLLAVGGYNQGTKPFSKIAADKNLRKKFVRTTMEFLKQWNFDGLDLDWEYPGGEGGKRTDKNNYVALLKELRNAIDTGNMKLLLSVAVPSGKTDIDKGYDIPQIAKYVDFINLMSYDFHGAWEKQKKAEHNSPLFPRNEETGADRRLNVDWAAKYWVDQGTPKEKLIIGLPTYGRHYKLRNKGTNDIGSRTKRAGTEGPYTKEDGFLAYHEVCELEESGQKKWNDEQNVRYLLHKDHWIGYDDEDSFVIKLEYIKENRYGGAMVWNIDMDDFDKLCPHSTRTFPLTRLLAEILGEYRPDYMLEDDGEYTPEQQDEWAETSDGEHSYSGREYKGVCYFTNWAQYRKGMGKYKVSDIDPFLCTHLIYAFAKMENYQLALDGLGEQEMYSEFNAWKQTNPKLKTLIAIGGWNAGSEDYSNMVSDASRRQHFAKTAVDFLIKHGFDGLDLDWEYPAKRGGVPEDKRNFIEWIKDIRKEFDAQLPRLLLTAAVGAGKSTIDKSYDIPEMAKYLDFINLMSYDLHGSWDGFVGHNSPLYKRSDESKGQERLNVDWAVKTWVQKGTPKEKLIIGLPTYGRNFQLKSRNNDKFGDEISGPGPAGPYTNTAGFLTYYEVCQKLSLNQGKRDWHSEHKVPYVINGDEWIGYDDKESFSLKLGYIKQNGYGGAMVWALDMDDFNGQLCSNSGGERYPLMSLIKRELGYNSGNDDSNSDIEDTSSDIEDTSSDIEDTTFESEDTSSETIEYKRVCYYTNWAQYRNGLGKYKVSEIDPFLCTHLIYSFAKIDNYQLATYEWNDETMYQQFNELKNKNPKLKTLIAIGGWNAGSEDYSNMVSDATRRQHFAKTAVDFLIKYDFDGLDLDWEYPAKRGGKPEDKANFIEWIKDIKKEFDAQLPRLLLTAAVGAGKSTIDQSYDIPQMAKYLDFINLMSYDLHGNWDGYVGHNSPLYKRSDETNGQERLNVDWAANTWVQKGTPKEKLIIGLPTYGRNFELKNRNNNNFGDATSGAGPKGQYTKATGFLAYYEVCQKLYLGQGTRYWHDEHKVPYVINGDEWIGYDDESSFLCKLDYIKTNGYGGAMVWALDLDDFNGKICSSSAGNQYPLMSLIKRELDDNSGSKTVCSGDTSDGNAYTVGGGTDTSVSTWNDNNPVDTEPQTQGGDEAVPQPQILTQAPFDPTAFCKEKQNGNFNHKDDCAKYVMCSHSRAFVKSCSSGTYWNGKNCDWKWKVNCEDRPETRSLNNKEAPSRVANALELLLRKLKMEQNASSELDIDSSDVSAQRIDSPKLSLRAYSAKSSEDSLESDPQRSDMNDMPHLDDDSKEFLESESSETTDSGMSDTESREDYIFR